MSDSDLRSPAGLERFFGRFSMLLAVLLPLQVVLSYLLLSYPGRPDLSLVERAALLAGEAGMLAVLLLFLVALVHVLFSLLPRRIACSVVFPMVAIACLLWIASWTQFALVGSFLGPAATEMFLQDTMQLFWHVRAFAEGPAIMALGGAIALTIFLSFIGHHAWNMGSRSTLLASVSGFLLFACLAALFLAGRPSSATPMEDRVEFRSAQARSGPLNGALSEILASHENVFVSGSPVSNEMVMERRTARAPFTTQPRNWNVLFVVIESLRPDALTSFGGNLDVMPGLDKLASQGWRFRKAFAHSSHSNYADVSLLTSQYPLRTPGPYYYPENPSFPVVTLPDLLVPQGWRAAMFSSQNEHWGGMLNVVASDKLDAFIHAGMSSAELRDEKILYRNQAFEEYREKMTRRKTAGKIDDSVTVDLALDWLSRQPDDQPFYLYLNLQNSHIPFYVPDGFDRRFFPDDPELLETLREGRIIELSIEQMHLAYLDSLAYIDAQLLRVFDELEKDGKLEDTLVVVTGDTAVSFYTSLIDDEYNTRLLGNGGPLVPEVLRVPLLLRVPGSQPRSIDSPVGHVDVLPTVLELMGLPSEPAFQGMPLSRLDRNARPVFLAAQSPGTRQYGVISDGWMFVFDGLDGSAFWAPIDEAEQEKPSTPHHPSLLETWMDLQYRYYGAPGLQARYYPPQHARWWDPVWQYHQ